MSDSTLAFYEAATQPREVPAAPQRPTTTHRQVEFDSNQTKAQQAIARYRADIIATKQDTRLTPQGKQETLTRLWQAARAQVAQIQQAEQQAKQDRATALRKSLLDPGHLASSDRIGYYDSIERANRLDTEDAALNLIKQASSIGDGIVEKAVLSRAYEQRWANVINAYEAAHASMSDKAEELWNLTETPTGRNQIGAALVDSLAYTVPQPSEVTGV